MTDRCLERLRDENSLIWPMMVSAMFRAFSKALSCSDRGSDFMFLRTRVNSVSPRRNRSSASFWPILALVAEELAGQIAGQRRDRRGVMDIARSQLQGDDLMAVVEDEVQFEAEEPAHLAALGQTGECRLMR